MDMKKLTKLVIGVIALALVIAAVVFVVRLVGGLITGAFNLVLDLCRPLRRDKHGREQVI